MSDRVYDTPRMPRLVRLVDAEGDLRLFNPERIEEIAPVKDSADPIARILLIGGAAVDVPGTVLDVARAIVAQAAAPWHEVLADPAEG